LSSLAELVAVLALAGVQAAAVELVVIELALLVMLFQPITQ
jgi:hypothetical protein